MQRADHQRRWTLNCFVANTCQRPIERLLYLQRSDANRAVAFAITTIFDRAAGKAPVKIEGDGESFGLMHLIAARSVAEAMRRAMAAGRLPEPPDERNAPVLDLTDPVAWQHLPPRWSSCQLP